MKKNLALLLVLVLVAVLAVSGCTTTPKADGQASAQESASESAAAPASESAAAADGASGGKTMTIGMSWAHKNDSLFYAMEDTLAKAMDELKAERGYDNVEWIHVIANDDAQKQAADIEDLITKDVDLIVSYAQDNEAIKSSIESAQKAGIPFICYDRDATPGGVQPDGFVGLDSTEQAYTTGKALFQAMKDAGVAPTSIISIVGALNDTNATNRIAGFKKAADEYGVTIKQEVPSDWDANKALEGFTAAFQANPDCNCVLIASDFIITAVQSVLEANGKWIPNGQEGHVWIGSQDVFPAGLQFIREGYIDYDTAYDLWAIAQNFAPMAYDLVEGKDLGNPKIIEAGRVVSKENVDTLENLWARDYE